MMCKEFNYGIVQTSRERNGIGTGPEYRRSADYRSVTIGGINSGIKGVGR
jgi:hypothetical protein